SVSMFAQAFLISVRWLTNRLYIRTRAIPTMRTIPRITMSSTTVTVRSPLSPSGRRGLRRPGAVLVPDQPGDVVHERLRRPHQRDQLGRPQPMTVHEHRRTGELEAVRAAGVDQELLHAGVDQLEGELLVRRLDVEGPVERLGLEVDVAEPQVVGQLG